MVQDETTVVDLEVGTGRVYQTTVSKSWIWKTFVAIAFIGLCSVAAVFFSWHMMKSDQKELQTFAEQAKQIPTPSEHGKMLMRIAERTKAAIHLHGVVDGDSLKWVTDVNQSFAQGGLELDENQINVPVDGLYYVYSQVSYTIKCKGDNKTYDLSHRIFRFSDSMGKSIPLLTSTQSSSCYSEEEGKIKYSTIYLGSVFVLNKDDKLYTESTHVKSVDEDSTKTFFGVFAL